MSYSHSHASLNKTQLAAFAEALRTPVVICTDTGEVDFANEAALATLRLESQQGDLNLTMAVPSLRLLLAEGRDAAVAHARSAVVQTKTRELLEMDALVILLDPAGPLDGEFLVLIQPKPGGREPLGDARWVGFEELVTDGLGLVHDLDNLLGVIVNQTSLRTGTTSDDKVLRDTALRAGDLTRQLKHLSLAHNTPLHPIDVGRVAREVLVALEASNETSVVIEGSFAEALCRAGLCHQKWSPPAARSG